MRRAWAALMAMLSLASAGRAGEREDPSRPFDPKSAQTLVLGDSITYDGHWVEYVQAALILAGEAPPKPFINCALPSETVSGLSEPGHAGGKFLRPDLHERLARVLAQVRPTQVIASYGENDGIYKPFTEERFKAYQDGIAWLRSEISRTGASLILMTPTGFDKVPVAAKVVPAGREDAAHVYEGYDGVLARYSAWLVSLRGEGVAVIDVHSAFAAALAEHRRADPSFTFAGHDGVHPDPEGHAVIAQAFLKGVGLPDRVAAEPLGWAGAPPHRVVLLREQDTLLKDGWLTATGHKRPGMKPGLPLPQMQPKVDALEAEILANP